MKFAEFHRRIFSTRVVSDRLVRSFVTAEKLDRTSPKGTFVLSSLRDKVEGVDYFLPKIDLGNGKPRLPIAKPSELKTPAILDYATNDTLQNFMDKNSTDGRLEVILIENSTKAYADIHMLKGGFFENYFKAANHLDAKEEDACTRHKYFELVVSH